jgi:hypothetical protein
MLNLGKVREIRHPDWVVRDDRLTHATGWRAAIPASEGFRQTVAWYRQHGMLR